MKLRLIVMFIVAALGLVAVPGSAYAALPSCSGYTGGGKDVNCSAFMGHKIRITY